MKPLFDLVVIGAGPGGYTAAVAGSQKGLKVCLIEKAELGGTCLNHGCIPTKALLSSVRFLEQLKSASSLGITIKGEFDFKGVFERKEQIVRRLRQGLQTVIKSYGIEVIKGEAEFVSDRKIRVGNQNIAFKSCIIATGSRPVLLPGVQIDGHHLLNSNQLLAQSEVPARLVIIGGGVIGIEMACIFRAMGAEVSVVEALPFILPGIDEEISGLLLRFLKRKGIKFFLGQKVKKIDCQKTGEVHLELEEKQLTASTVLMAIGRQPNTQALGLERIGVKQNRGFILVNGQMQTTCPGIYAVGDVVGGKLLAHKASAESLVAVKNICGEKASIDYYGLPSAIFTLPEVGSVGLSEKAARAQGLPIKVGKFPLAASGRAVCSGETLGLIKVIVHQENDRLLGVHIIGDQATEIINLAALIIKTGLKIQEIPRLTFAHPTYTEALYQAIQDADNMATDLPLKIK